MILIVATRFDKSETGVMETLIGSTLNVLDNRKSDYKLIRVPGAVELPLAAQRWVQSNPGFKAVIALGCVIKGDSDHYELVTQSVTQGLTALALKLNLPIIQGVLACHNAEQATARAHLGSEFADTALEMMNTLPPQNK